MFPFAGMDNTFGREGIETYSSRRNADAGIQFNDYALAATGVGGSAKKIRNRPQKPYFRFAYKLEHIDFIDFFLYYPVFFG